MRVRKKTKKPKLRRNKIRNPYAWSIVGIVLACVAIYLFIWYELVQCSINVSRMTIPKPEPTLMVNERYFVGKDDLQEPELPTGCEATAAATFLRIHGIDISKIEMADALDKGDDFIHQFMGDPSNDSGLVIMAPGLADTMQKFVPDYMHIVTSSLDMDLSYMGYPGIYYVTMNCAEPMYSDYVLFDNDREYRILWNTHTVVVTDISKEDGYVKTIDPMYGEKTYDYSQFEQAWIANGKQAIFLIDDYEINQVGGYHARRATQ